MILPDVNVLIYAFRRDMPQHAVCRAWLVDVVRNNARFGLSPLVLGAVVHVTLIRAPSVCRVRLRRRSDFCGNLLGQPHCQIVEPESGTGKSSGDCESRRITYRIFRTFRIGGFF